MAGFSTRWVSDAGCSGIGPEYSTDRLPLFKFQYFLFHFYPYFELIFLKLFCANYKPELNFKRTIRKLPDNVEPSEKAIEELLNNTELNNLMGDILVELMQEQIKQEKENEQRDSKGTN